MKKKSPAVKFKSHLDRLETFFSSWRFPVFTLTVLLFFGMLVVGISLTPVSDSGLGTFAEEFKTWCLGYDPATGEIEYIYLIMFIVQPLIISLFVFAFWYTPLLQLLKEGPKQAWPYFTSGLVLVALVGASLPSLFTYSAKGELPFPAEELRTKINPPRFSLVNQHKQTVSLDEYRENVVLITAVYASCSETCPLILEEVKRVFTNLPEEKRHEVQLMAITMDPNKDTPRMLKMTADHYGLNASNQHLLTGDPGQINSLLDRLNIPRQRNEDGTINHANLFILVDKNGKIAYRFTLGDRQERWLSKAIRLLVNENHYTVNNTVNHSINR